MKYDSTNAINTEEKPNSISVLNTDDSPSADHTNIPQYQLSDNEKDEGFKSGNTELNIKDITSLPLLNPNHALSKKDGFRLNEELFQQYQISCMLKPNTAQTYKNAIQQFYQYVVRENVTSISRTTVLEWIHYLTYVENKKAKTVQIYLRGLKSFVHFLMDEKLLQEDITRHVKAPKAKEEYYKLPLSEEQVADLLDQPDIQTVKGRRDYAMILSMLILGLRCIEVSRAKIENLTFENGGHYFYPFGKGRDELASSDILVVPDTLYEALQDMLKDRENTKPEDPLFCSLSNNSKERPITPNSVSRILFDYLQKIGLKPSDNPELSGKYTAHSCRHTTATLALVTAKETGSHISIREVQQHLRHSDLRFTEIYSHDIERRNLEVSDLLADKISHLTSKTEDTKKESSMDSLKSKILSKIQNSPNCSQELSSLIEQEISQCIEDVFNELNNETKSEKR